MTALSDCLGPPGSDRWGWVLDHGDLRRLQLLTTTTTTTRDCRRDVCRRPPGRHLEPHGMCIRHISKPAGAHLGSRDGPFSWAAPVCTVLCGGPRRSKPTTRRYHRGRAVGRLTEVKMACSRFTAEQHSHRWCIFAFAVRSSLSG